jgi:hypothetical protein
MDSGHIKKDQLNDFKWKKSYCSIEALPTG